jgi:glycosyltransferase involved in cell wall biosynthesis
VRILIVTPAQPRTTGNWVSALRQQKGLEALGHHVHIAEAGESIQDLENETEDFVPDVVNVLHAYRCGRQWLACRKSDRIPLVVTLTGTDVNHGLANPEQGPTILTVLARAEAIITINALTTTELQRDYPGLASRLHHVPPALDCGHAPHALRHGLGIQRECVLFLHPAGIRPVKANLELLEMFEPVAASHSRCRLVFCGPMLDIDYGRRFLKGVKGRPWARYAGEIPVIAMPAAMQEADVVLNNSVSEGFSNALHEAAWLGTPVLARNIPGNMVAFESGRQGLLYDTPHSFVQQAITLARDPELRRRLSQPKRRVRSLMEEALQLEKIFLALSVHCAVGPGF